LLTSQPSPSKAQQPAAAAGRRSGGSVLAGIPVAAVGGTIGARLGATLLTFVAGIIVARDLGTHGRGLLALLIALPAALTILGVVGLDTANLRFAGRSHTAFAHIVRLAVVFSMATGTALSGAWLLAGRLWPAARFGLSPRLALLSAMLCPLSVLLTLLGAAEAGRGRTYLYNLVTAGAMSVYLAAVIGLAAGGQLTVVRCFASYEASQVLGIVAFLLLARTRVHGAGEKVPSGEYRSYSLRAYLPNLAQYGMLRMDIPVIQVLAGTKAVALYAVALPFAEGMLLLPVAVSLVMFSRVTSGELGRAATIQLSRTVLAGTAILAGAVVLAAPVAVPLVYGTAFGGSVAVIWCMLPGVVAFSGGRTIQTYLAGTDRLRPVIVASAAGLAAGLVGLVALVPRFGAAGAGAADSAGYLGYVAVITGCLRRDGQVSAARAATRRCARAATRWRAAAGGPRWIVAGLLAPAAAGLAVAGLSTVSTGTVITAGGALVLLLAVAAPTAGLYLLAIAIPVSQTASGAALSSARHLLGLVVACLLGQLAAGRLIRPRFRAAAVAAAAVTYFLISTLLVGGQGATARDLLNVLELSIPLLCLPLLVCDNRIARRALIAFSYSAACVAVAEVITSRASVAASSDLPAATSAAVAAGRTGALDHNAEGAVFILALCVLLAQLPRTRQFITRLAVAVAIAAVLAGVAYSFSRASYFGAIAVLAVFVLRRPARTLIGAAVAGAVLLPLAPAVITARIGTVWSSSGLDPSSAVRLDLWSSALRIFARDPVLGCGYLHFAVQLPAYFIGTGNFATAQIQLAELVYAHNTYLSVLAETGLAGAVLVAWLILGGWRAAWSAARAGRQSGECALLAITGLGVSSIFGEPLFVPAVLAAFLLVVLAARPSRTSPDGVQAAAGAPRPAASAPRPAAGAGRQVGATAAISAGAASGV
jgi:O-antigen/teichoic acid export membrane protein/O-antigen ligase